MAVRFTRDALVARLVRAGELEVSGEHPDELLDYFDVASFAFHGPDGFDSDFAGLSASFAHLRPRIHALARGPAAAERATGHLGSDQHLHLQ